eukprot:gene24560-10171_t
MAFSSANHVRCHKQRTRKWQPPWENGVYCLNTPETYSAVHGLPPFYSWELSSSVCF